MEGQSPRSSILSHATVIAAIISGITAMITSLLPWLLDKRELQNPSHSAAQLASSEVHAAPLSLSGSPAPINLINGVWTITNSTDDEGTNFVGSTLKFTSQHEVAGGVEAIGFFEWRDDYELIGREQVVATYDHASRRIYIQGKEVDQPERLAVGSFSAEVSEDGHRLLNGAWGNTPGYRVGVLGTWEARR
jgi:hypothetical protein